MKIISSQYDGICKVTGENYTVGTEIASIPGGWMIARYATVDGIREWAEVQKAEMLRIYNSIEGYPAEKIEMHTRKADEKIQSLLEEWEKAIRGFYSPERTAADVRNMVVLAQQKAERESRKATR